MLFDTHQQQVILFAWFVALSYNEPCSRNLKFINYLTKIIDALLRGTIQIYQANANEEANGASQNHFEIEIRGTKFERQNKNKNKKQKKNKNKNKEQLNWKEKLLCVPVCSNLNLSWSDGDDDADEDDDDDVIDDESWLECHVTLVQRVSAVVVPHWIDFNLKFI